MGEDFSERRKKGEHLQNEVAALFRSIDCKAEVNHSVTVLSRSVELDVYVETPHDQTILVECKYKEKGEEKAIGIETFAKVKDYLGRLEYEKGLVVTNGRVPDHFREFENDNVYFWRENDLHKLQAEGDKVKRADWVYKSLGLKTETQWIEESEEFMRQKVEEAARKKKQEEKEERKRKEEEEIKRLEDAKRIKELEQTANEFWENCSKPLQHFAKCDLQTAKYALAALFAAIILVSVVALVILLLTVASIILPPFVQWAADVIAAFIKWFIEIVTAVIMIIVALAVAYAIAMNERNRR